MGGVHETSTMHVPAVAASTVIVGEPLLLLQLFLPPLLLPPPFDPMLVSP
jgi:hypothetical protein